MASPTIEEQEAKPIRPRFSRFRRKIRDDKENGDPSGFQIKFVGKKHVVTSPMFMPKIGDEVLLNDFFSMDKNRDILFPKNDAAKYDGLLTNEMVETWNREAERGGATGPTTIISRNGSIDLNNTKHEKQQIIKISTLLEMPSLKITSESTIGIKLLLPIKGIKGNENKQFPEFQFTLLESQLIPQGSKAAVWIFNQLIKFRDLTSSFTRVTVEKVDSSSTGHGNRFAFVTDARLETRIHVPSSMSKVISSSNISKFEMQGSESIQKLLEKELEPALVGFRDAFNVYAIQKSLEVEGVQLHL